MKPAAVQQLPSIAVSHFRLYLYAAMLQVVERLTGVFESIEQALERFPFLRGYLSELATHGLDGMSVAEAPEYWREMIFSWEASVAQHLPLRELRQTAELPHQAIVLLMAAGLVEEDPLFGQIFAALDSLHGEHRPTAALLGHFLGDDSDPSATRALIRRLIDLGLLEMNSAQGSSLASPLHVPGCLWAAIRGDAKAALMSRIRYRGQEEFPVLGSLVLPDRIRLSLQRLPELFRAGAVSSLIVRGPRHNGRLSLLGAIASSMGRGVLQLHVTAKEIDGSDAAWRCLGPLATLLNAVPVMVLEAAPGESITLPPLNCFSGGVGMTLGTQGAVTGPLTERAITLTIAFPDTEGRSLLWQRGLPEGAEVLAWQLGERCRMTSGNIWRAAQLAKSCAVLDGRAAVAAHDIQQACRSLNREALDGLAARVATDGDWSQLIVSADTAAELAILLARCRYREQMSELVGDALAKQLNVGVRALFSGPSGTGKTLAARLLAAVLNMDIYRVDLSAVVNKYIGETEKNLGRILDLAEELDVILLFDEGDSLLAQRTGVQNASDRYANLETNFLLQRLESYNGILLITTNVVELIDHAFKRRMDVVVDFRLPEAAERLSIWQLHLPEDHVVGADLLEEVAYRCALSGGQIRNAVLHASLLALSANCKVADFHLAAAVEREYRKAAAICPLRRAIVAEREKV